MLGNNDIHFVPDDHYELTDDERKLTIVDIQEPQNGVYKCLTEDNTVIKTFDVDSKFKLNKLAKSQSVDDGVPTEIECSLKSVSDKIVIKSWRKSKSITSFQEGQDVVFNWFSIPEGADPNNANVERTKICSKGSSCSADGGKAEVEVLNLSSLVDINIYILSETLRQSG